MVDVLEDILESAQVAGQLHRVHRCLVERVAQFRLDNDPTLIPAVASYVEHQLADTGFGDPTTRLQVGVALRNALDQAMFHGNLELPSEARLEGELEFRDLAEQRVHADPYQGRSVWLTVAIEPDRAEFVVRHEGAGIPAELLPNPDDPTDLEDPLRHGLVLIQTFMDEVRMNPKGTELTMVKRRCDRDEQTPDAEHDRRPSVFGVVGDVEAPPVVFRDERNDDVLVVTVAQEGVGFAEHRRLQELDHLLHRLDEERLHRVVVDFGEVAAFGSAVLESLLAVWKRVKTHPDGCMACCRVAEPACIVLHLARFDTVWPLYDTLDDALAAVRMRG
jgi:anti-anti-sigma regulatory factor